MKKILASIALASMMLAGFAGIGSAEADACYRSRITGQCLPSHNDAQYFRTHGKIAAPEGVFGFNNNSGWSYLSHGNYNLYGAYGSVGGPVGVFGISTGR